MKPTTVLRRADPVTVSTNREGAVDILRHGRWERCPPATLAVLDAFSQPRRLVDVIDELSAAAVGRQHWIDLTATILLLRDKGLIVPAGEAPSQVREAGGFASAAAHISLLNDRARTSSMIEAIRQVVQPDDVVLDIGTGCGVLAVAAAQAGARHVFAVEATAAAPVARALCDANGVGDRVTVLEGWSTQLTLPVKASVLVAEIAGNEPFTAQLLEVVIDARARLLTSNATIIPRQVDVWAQPSRVGASDLSRVAFTDSNTGRWHDWYGLDFRALSMEHLLPAMIHVPGEVAASWERVGQPLLIAQIDLQTVEEPVVAASVVGQGMAGGAVNAVVGYTELALAPGRWRSGSPYIDDRGARWTVPVWLRPDPLVLAAGQPYRISLSYPGSTGRTIMTVV